MNERLGDWYDPKDLREYKDPRPDWLQGKHGMLSDRDILRCLEEGIIQIIPLPKDLENCLDSCKIDFHLGNIFTTFKRPKISDIELDSEIPEEYQEDIVVRDGDYYMLHPGETVIAVTKERLILPNFISARMEGKSKLARRGLGIQLAAVIDAGWNDHPALELHNSGLIAIRIRPPTPIGAFSFHLLTSPALNPYGSRSKDRFTEQQLPRY